MLQPQPYDDLMRGFSWDLPDALNMAAQICDTWAARAPERVALIDLRGPEREDLSYGALQALSFAVQAALRARGIMPGDRVGVLLPQSPLCAAAHCAIWRMGAVSVPLFTLFQEAALNTRLGDSGAALVVTDTAHAGLVAPLGVAVLCEDDLAEAGPQETCPTGPDSPAVLIYTSGTTGSPKGALHGHRVLSGHLPGVEISHDFLGQPGDVLWTPADWAWIGGLFDVLMPGLALGVPVVAGPSEKFSAALCRHLLARADIRNVFFPPTALRMLKAEGAVLRGLRSVACGGEPLGDEMRLWGLRALGVEINEFYGQTECNMVVSSASGLFLARSGCIGKPVPGFEIAVLGQDGRPCEEEGDIAIRRGAASMMLSYWNRPEETAAKFRGDWLITGDRGRWEDGFVRFVGREDDVITSAGYRIGPAEIEDCLLTHPDVATVAVVGKPDPLRTEIVKAFVVLQPEALADPGALQDWVKTRLARHCYPREIEFVSDLPMTVTGKVIRKALKARAAEGLV